MFRPLAFLGCLALLAVTPAPTIQAQPLELEATTNLITNSSFETSTTGWSSYGGSGASIARVSGGHTGGYSVRCRSTSSASVHFGIQDSPAWVGTVVGAGAVYRFTCWVRSDASRGQVKIKVKEYLGSTQKGSTKYSAGVALSSSWKAMTLDYTVTTAGSRLELWIEDYPAASAETFFIDDVSIVIASGAGSSPPPPEGNTSGPIAVYAGYYDTHHPGRTQSKPSPWKGASGVVFVGKPDSPSGGWDTSAIRIDNVSGGTLSGVLVTVDIGSRRYALWGSQTMPAGGKLILAQTAYENFDGSDTNPAGCIGCSSRDCVSRVSSTVPVVHVTIGSKRTDFYDVGQTLNTHGVDAAGCPYTGTRNDESLSWKRIYPKLALVAHAGADIEDDAAQVSEAFATDRYLWLGPTYPNPTRGQFGVRFRTATPGAVRLGVYDITGRVVKMFVDRDFEAGAHFEHVDMTGTAPGIYFCELWTPEGTLRESFVVIR